MREPMETLVDSKVRIISILASIQSSKTSVAELGLLYIIANLPGPLLWLDQTDDDAADQAESRLGPLMDECQPVKSLYPLNRHKLKNTTKHFRNGMTMWVLGAHNKTNLQRRSIRWLIGDETWRWPAGHMAEAEARVTAFGWLGKCLFLSQGGTEGDDTHRKHETTDQREWTFLCPSCQTRQPFKWENIEWSKDAKTDDGWDYARVRATTVMQCECGHTFEDTDMQRRLLALTGAYVVTNQHASAENVGFHWNALCCMSWGRLAELYLRAKQIARAGDIEPLRQFYQKRLALPWRDYLEDFKIEISASDYKMREPWANEAGVTQRGLIAPSKDEPGVKAPLRFLTVDCQLDHLFCLVRSWDASGNSRLFHWDKVPGWEDVDALRRECGVHSSLVFIDAGYRPYDVYRECAKRGWTALIGDKRPTFAHKLPSGKVVHRFYSQRRRVVLGKGQQCSVFYWSNLNIKDMLSRLRRNQDPGRGTTWEIASDAGADYLAQLESEQRVKRANRWIWEQIGKRPNHLWDCECEQVVAAVMLKIVGREAHAAVEAETSQDESLDEPPD